MSEKLGKLSSEQAIGFIWFLVGCFCVMDKSPDDVLDYYLKLYLDSMEIDLDDNIRSTETCEWTHFPHTTEYKSGCGEVWTYSYFVPGGESNHKFCTHCGGRIVVVVKEPEKERN